MAHPVLLIHHLRAENQRDRLLSRTDRRTFTEIAEEPK
jgi:hypothetical protein